MSNELCYVCLKPLKLAYASLFLEDDDHRGVHVGPDCFEHAVEAGYAGIVSGKGKGPRVFANFAMAEAFAAAMTSPETCAHGRTREQDCPWCPGSFAPAKEVAK